MKANFKRKVLSNGMTVILEKRDLPIVTCAIAVKNGGINESREEKGISHFIEHMLYKGTEKRTAKQIASDIEKNGGELNGFTDEEVTAFWCKMPKRHGDVALDVLTDIILNSKFDLEEFEKERKVIFEELKMRKDSPRVYVFDKINSFLYEEPFGSDLIGTYETMNSITREQMVNRWEEVYVPENMIFAVVGDYDFDSLVNFCEKNFVGKKGKVGSFEIKKKKEIRIESRDGVDQANLVFAFHVPPVGDKREYASYVLSAIMAEGMSSRLFSEIREKRNLAYAVKGDVVVSKDYAHLIIYVGTTKENVEEVKNLILKEFEVVSKELGSEEFEQVKEQLYGNYEISMEDSQAQMVNLILQEIEGDASRFYEFPERISKVELEDVKEVAKMAKNYSFFALVPKD